jgi:predicted adenylyl cyclase CyaB
MEEIEIKFAVKDTQAVRDKLRKLGFRIAVGRHREKNYLFDDSSGNLRQSGKLLRLRKTPTSQTLTYKGPISARSKLKRREEIECRVENADVLIGILLGAGFRLETEYSKYRTVFEKDQLNVSLDETEAGTFLEVEGPSEEEVTKAGEELGYSERDFIRRTYAELIGEKRTG